ncbi:putative colanic acid biosynthesis acetyltransferase WcaF [Maribacter orientalis]|uniref:Putative colanic acid biosynthesis acetyltransferase WcaF n=1 Tax=Maribacter orientalis TaxID=228957 RepID=A0A1H7N8W1_9FLAO|nr:WcaF family extracellular polysaccharide biosynthesis acetyltransferase [Maribacter orientalis]SEL20032.1 putative colanic acid biosynthesis acetyltransferase WcaF [Maribacter orientalis]|tara:strand:- start:3670 stop:4230 length:561 start_codon:yes stop_codon:yes gene_type:complete
MDSKPTMDLSIYQANEYKPGSFFKRAVWYITNRLFFKSSIHYSYAFKRFLLLLFGAKIGKNPTIKPGLSIKYPWFLEIADNVWLGEDVWIDNIAKVTIGSNVCISQGALILTGSHNYKSRSFDLILGPVTLKDGVWIGAKSIVCPGVTCKSHAVLAVGSVASKDLEPYMVYKGNPPVCIRERNISK